MTRRTSLTYSIPQTTTFFHRVKSKKNNNSNHVLQPYRDIPYLLRTRSHSMTLIEKTKFLSDANFLSVCCINIRTNSH